MNKLWLHFRIRSSVAFLILNLFYYFFREKTLKTLGWTIRKQPKNTIAIISMILGYSGISWREALLRLVSSFVLFTPRPLSAVDFCQNRQSTLTCHMILRKENGQTTNILKPLPYVFEEVCFGLISETVTQVKPFRSYSQHEFRIGCGFSTVLKWLSLPFVLHVVQSFISSRWVITTVKVRLTCVLMTRKVFFLA